MPPVRSDERPKVWFRSERVFLSNNEWYFHTREGVDVGPYPSLAEAQVESGMLRELLRPAARGEPALHVIREFVLESYSLGRPLAPNFSRVLMAAEQPIAAD